MSKFSPITRTKNWFVGEDKILDFVVTGADDETAEDVTGWTFEWTLRRYGGAALITKTAPAITTPDPLLGQVAVQVDDTDTDDLPAGIYFHRLSRTDAGFEEVLAEGPAILQSHVGPSLAPLVMVDEVAALVKRAIADDDFATRMNIDIASQAIRSYCGQDITTVYDDVAIVDGKARGILLLPQIPVLDITSIELLSTSPATALVEGTDFVWDRAGILRRLPEPMNWELGRQIVSVTYDHGYSEVPADIRGVCCAAVARMLANPTGLQSETTTSYQSSFSKIGAFEGASVHLTEADRGILDAYRLTEA